MSEAQSPRRGGARSGARLSIVEGPVAETTIPLLDEGTVGRRRDNTYVLASARVSRVHARIWRVAGEVVIVDLGSRAGTRVNGQRIEGPQVLRDGDRVQFGPVTTVFEDPSAGRSEDVTDVLEIPAERRVPHLSPRQQQVLELMAEGMTNAEIGDRLGVTERTVKAYARELYDRLEVNSRAGAVAAALKQGILRV